MTPLMRGRSVAATLLRRVGLEVRRYSNSLPAKRARLLAREEVEVVLDVGANVGQYGLDLRASGFRGRIISFEPLSDAFAELLATSRNDPTWVALNMAIGDEDGEFEMHVSENSVSSSLLQMRPQLQRVVPKAGFVGQEAVTVRRLESAVASVIPPGKRCHLKIDTQGYEMRVLSGIGPISSQLLSLEIEMSLVPLYEGQASAAEVIGFMEDHGYRLVWLERGLVDLSSGDLLEVDGLFRRMRQE